MVSSNGIQQSKKISQGFRHFSKRFFEDFYAKEREAGRHPPPIQAALALGRVLELATDGDWVANSPDRPGVTTEAYDLFVSSFSQQAFLEAVGAYGRYTPGLEIKKGKPGRKPNVELAQRVWALDAEGKKNREIQQTLNAGGESLSLEAVESYLKKRRRPRNQ